MIPKEWDARQLKEIIFITHGFAFASKHFANHGQFRLTTPGHFYEKGGFRDIGEKQKFYIGPILSDYVLQPSDMIIAMTEQADGLLGSAALIPEIDCYLHNQRLGRVSAISSQINLCYLFYVFNSEKYRAKVRETAAGTKVKHTSPDKLLEIAVCLPPLTEQTAIANALSDIDALLAKLDQLIAKKRDLKQAAMQQLLTGQIRLPGFSKEWVVKQLGEVFTISAGKSKSAYIIAGGRHWIVDMGSVSTDGRLIVSKPTNYSGDFLKIGDLVMPKDDIGGGGIIGKVGYIDTDKTYVLGDHVYRLTANMGNPLFLSYVINGYRTNTELRKKVIGSAQLGLGRKSVNEQEVPFPPYNEQTAIATILSNMDTEISTIEARRDKTKDLKQGMMQELLTGRIRLI